MKLPEAQRIHKLVTREQQAIVDALRRLVDQPSYSHEPEMVSKVGDLIDELMPTSFERQVIHNDTFAPHRIYRNASTAGQRIVMAGHMDTLCPRDGQFNTLTVDGGKLRGPGVNDMKAGLITLIWSLRVLDSLGYLAGLPVDVIVNTDEELGSPTSSSLFCSMRDTARLALVYECGGPAGTLVTTRKGNIRRRLRITGKADHWGNLSGPKVSAIETLGHAILAAEGLNRPDGSLVANVGRVAGGLAANAIAAEALLEVDCRAWEARYIDQAKVALDEIAASPAVKGTRIGVEPMPSRPPMTPGREAMQLFDQACAVGNELGQTIIEEKRGGMSDGCFLSDSGIPTIDGFGPLGDGDFTRDEHIVTDTLFSRIELSANLLLALAE